ncbi:MAG: hypothetical protein EOM47_00570 [Bacteroidia bacterium]|nr:hypothetical protein [Bacteroidia bacterium]
MSNYRYTLQRKGSKLDCPSCGHKKRFVPYIDTTTGQPIHRTVGKCDRESNCGYHLTPSEYFKSNDIKPKYTNFVPKPEPPKPMGLLPTDLVSQSESMQSNFVAFLSTLFPDGAIVQNVCNKYRVGATKQREVIFWQVDEHNRVRSGKIMQYDPTAGKRSKTQLPNWVHSKMIKAGKLNADFNLIQCFYGQHLLNSNPSATVAIVESEKTATIASVLMPKFIWLAAGQLHGLNIEKCSCLSGRNVMLFPDLSEKKENRMTAFEVWSAKATEIMKAYKCKVLVSDLLEKTASKADRANGSDIADYLINERRAKIQEPEKLAEVRRVNNTRAEKSDVPEVENRNSTRARAECSENAATKAQPAPESLELSDIALQAIGERNHLSERDLMDRLVQLYQINESIAETRLKSLIDNKLIEPTHIGTYVLCSSTPF